MNTTIHQASTSLSTFLLLTLAALNPAADEPASRTDPVAEKIRLIQESYQQGRHDLAMSLAESLKDTLSYERQAENRPAPPHLVTEQAKSVSALPRPWSDWARGWSHFHAISLMETAGIARRNEPVHVRFSVSRKEMTDPWREIRVARIHPTMQTLEEIPSQVLQHVKGSAQHHCELVFQVDVTEHGAAHYLILFGNPHAELPSYSSDLRSDGEGYALEIENHFYQAHLARQMGQLERLISKRQHGLELYAGGKGHGEPPTIDWAHDYVDEGNFQKLRMKNWDTCPNFEVIRGPVCIQVRRWGFPHSPIHPLFTPSRIHIDQTYTFYARVPHFFKEGTMEVVKDVNIAAMRDDEWVFSGYSFDQTLWIDRGGEVHEGPVPGEQANDLWGVGFFHRTSRDAFVALWLQHESTGFPEIQHSGAPTLHYDGHGQLWSRYPANEASLTAGTVFRQRNAYLLTHYPKENGRDQIARIRRQLLNPVELRNEGIPTAAAASTEGHLARPGETQQAAPLKHAIWNALRKVKDEQLYQIDANIVDLGYVYDVRVKNRIVTVLLTMPHRGRPFYQFLVTQGGGRLQDGIQETLRRIDGVQDVIVEFTWEPAWNIHRVTDQGMAALGLAR